MDPRYTLSSMVLPSLVWVSRSVVSTVSANPQFPDRLFHVDPLSILATLLYSIVGHAQKVRLITKSRRKDDRLDARTLARLARIDPELLSPVKHRSAQAQLHLTEIRARGTEIVDRAGQVTKAKIIRG
jgi:hypothetical protein